MKNVIYQPRQGVSEPRATYVASVNPFVATEPIVLNAPPPKQPEVVVVPVEAHGGNDIMQNRVNKQYNYGQLPSAQSVPPQVHFVSALPDLLPSPPPIIITLPKRDNSLCTCGGNYEGDLDEKEARKREREDRLREREFEKREREQEREFDRRQRELDRKERELERQLDRIAAMGIYGYQNPYQQMAMPQLLPPPPQPAPQPIFVMQQEQLPPQPAPQQYPKTASNGARPQPATPVANNFVSYQQPAVPPQYFDPNNPQPYYVFEEGLDEYGGTTEVEYERRLKEKELEQERRFALREIELARRERELDLEYSTPIEPPQVIQPQVIQTKVEPAPQTIEQTIIEPQVVSSPPSVAPTPVVVEVVAPAPEPPPAAPQGAMHDMLASMAARLNDMNSKLE